MASLSCVDSKEADSDDGRTHQPTTRSENRIPLLLLNWMDNCRWSGRVISHHIPSLTGLILYFIKTGKYNERTSLRRCYFIHRDKVMDICSS